MAGRMYEADIGRMMEGCWKDVGMVGRQGWK